ncbi:unnamed protein product [Trifolium pratense]|uniref:Uncharacterized protein n=1 Tax=Trifolium pratense TaxID=57577 RepID=A0ACB0KPL8_TRIPR|nr:unnamed protein product [Trifolium pratense]
MQNLHKFSYLLSTVSMINHMLYHSCGNHQFMRDFVGRDKNKIEAHIYGILIRQLGSKLTNCLTVRVGVNINGRKITKKGRSGSFH